MLVNLCLSVLLSLMSHIAFICTIIFELMNKMMMMMTILSSINRLQSYAAPSVESEQDHQIQMLFMLNII